MYTIRTLLELPLGVLRGYMSEPRSHLGEGITWAEDFLTCRRYWYPGTGGNYALQEEERGGKVFPNVFIWNYLSTCYLVGMGGLC
jgi:hypothetical protein